MAKHWSEENEQVRTGIPILVMLGLIKIFPCFIVNLIAFPVAFFYFLFSKRARDYIFMFQKQLKEFTGGKIPERISVFRTILSFSLCLIERISGWLGKIKEKDIIYNDDDINDYWKNLMEGRGAFLIGSHLGDIDLLRSLSTFSRAGIKKEIPVTVISEIKSDEKFNRALKKINPKYELTSLDPKDIGPETIIILQEKISRGEIVVVTGDRTSAHARSRFIRLPFLGKEAEFPYGIFLIAALIQTSSVYFVFGIREKTFMLNPRNRVYMQKSKVVFTDCKRSERDIRIRELGAEFAGLLEKFCVKFPFQWYNFFDFWALTEAEKTV